MQRGIELEKQSKPEEVLALYERLLNEIDSNPQLQLPSQERESIRSFLKMRKAGLLRDKGQSQEALCLMEEALVHAETSGNKVQIGRCKLGLGVLYARLDNLQEGQQRLEEAVSYFRVLREEGSEQGLGWALLNLGRLLAKAGQPQVGIARLEEAVEVLKRIGNHVGVATAYKFLGEIHLSRG